MGEQLRIENELLQSAPTRETVRRLLNVVAPGSTLSAIQHLPGSYSNSTHIVTARNPDGSAVQLVVRRYVHGNRAQKARLEFETLAFLQNHDVPAPAPVLLDDAGEWLGTPGIVTAFARDRQMMLPAEHPSGRLDWARALGAMLARIHSIPFNGVRHFLLDANAEATWFLRHGTIPDYMRSHPDGAAVWRTVDRTRPQIQHVEPRLVHIDYWRGNVLWHKGQISAVVDWEEAACGDPGIDVAYCRMEMVIMGFIEEAAEFLNAYEAELGRKVVNLGFWELAAAARPMYNLAEWITDPFKGQRFRLFIADALEQSGR